MNEPLRANARSFGDRYLLFFCRIHPSSSRSGFSSANRHKHLLALILAISTALSAQYNALYFSQDGTLNALSYETIDVFDFSNDKTTTISEELFRPFGMAQLKDGNYIVADSGNSTVKILDKQGICLSSFGKTGNGDTDLMSPLGLALDSRENVIISDTGNNCIKVFDKAGKLLLKFGKRGYGESEFLNPFHVFTDREDNIYVVDPGNICVKKFNKEGKFLLKFSDGLKSVSDAAIDNEGNVFICDFKDRRVKIFSKTSAYLTFYLDDYYYQEPILIAISLTNDIAVTDKGKNRLEVMRKGKPVYTKQGYEDNRSGNLYSATVGKDKTIYATYFSSDYIFCYDGTGKFLRKFGGSGEAPGLFNQPRGIAVDSRGRVFLCDSFNKRIQYFSKEGLFLGELTPLDWPLQLTIDHEDYLYVSESGTSSIYKLRVPVPSGTGEIQENEHLSKTLPNQEKCQKCYNQSCN